MLTVWTQIKPEKMSGLIWIQTVLHSDRITERIKKNDDFEKKSADDKKHAKFPSRQRVQV